VSTAIATPEITAPTAVQPILRTEKLVKIYGGRAVVNGVDLNIRPGEVVGVLGPNGAGKTTTFYMVVGLVRPNGGRVIFKDQDVTDFPMHRRARMGMGYLPQEESIFRKLTVEENITAILEAIHVPRRERKGRLAEHIEELGLGHVAKQKAFTLSGGERRRLEIARALVTRPHFLLMDEPFAAIDPISVAEVQKIILQLKSRGIGIIVTDHNVRETLRIVDRAYLIHKGSVLTEGSGDFLIHDEKARKFYLGEDFNL